MKLILSAIISIVLSYAITGHAQYGANKTFPTLIETAQRAVSAAEMIGLGINQTNHQISLILKEFKSVKEELKSLKEQFYTSHLVATGTALTAVIMSMTAAFMVGRHMAKRHTCFNPEMETQ